MTRARTLKALTGGSRVLTVVGAAAVVIMMVHIVTNALLRSFNDTPLTGTNEYVTYWYMPLIALIGFILAQRERGHTEASVLFDRLPRRNRTELHVAGLVLTGVVCAGFACFGWLEAWHNWRIGLTGGVVGVVIWPMTFLVPVTYAVLAMQVWIEAARVVLRPGRLEDPRHDDSDGEA